MPRGKSSRQPTKRSTNVTSESYGVEFVSVLLSSEDKEAIGAADVTDQDLFYQLEEWAENGYKVSLSIDFNNTGGICAVTGKQGCTVVENTNKCLVSRGRDIRQAIVVAMYKFANYCPDNVFPTAVTFRGDDIS